MFIVYRLLYSVCAYVNICNCWSLRHKPNPTFVSTFFTVMAIVVTDVFAINLLSTLKSTCVILKPNLGKCVTRRYVLFLILYPKLVNREARHKMFCFWLCVNVTFNTNQTNKFVGFEVSLSMSIFFIRCSDGCTFVNTTI